MNFNTFFLIIFLFVFLQRAEAWKISFWPFCSVQKHEKSTFDLSAVCRSMKNQLLAFLQCAEAWKINFWPFCSVQKHEKSLFCLSAVCSSMKNLFLAFLQCAEAWKIAFWSFRAARKHEKMNFGLSAPRRSMKKRILAFPRHAEAWKNEFWPFRATKLLLFYSFRLEILIKFEMSVLKNISTRRLFLFFSYLCFVLFENNLIIIATQVKLVFWLD